MVCRLTPTAAIADVNWTENRNGFFFLVYICMQMCESTFVVRSSFSLFVSICSVACKSPSPADSPQCRSHSIQITLHFGYAVRCSPTNVFIKWIAVLNYMVAASAMNDWKSQKKNGLCKLCAWRSCLTQFLSSVERTNQKKKKRKWSPRCHRFSFLLPLRSSPLIACDVHVCRILFIRAYEFFMKNSRFNFYLRAKNRAAFFLSLSSRFQICTHKINMRFFLGYFLCGTICVLVH